MTSRINFKKIKEEKDLAYLEGWYCPLEAARESEPNVIAGRGFPNMASIPFIPSVTFRKIPLKVSHKHVMAGF